MLYTDVRHAAMTDDIADSVNYKAITKRIIEHVENSADYLVENWSVTLRELLSLNSVWRGLKYAWKTRRIAFCAVSRHRNRAHGRGLRIKAMHRVVLLLGSNIDKEHNLPRAVALLDELTTVIAVSSIYESAPQGLRSSLPFSMLPSR